MASPAKKAEARTEKVARTPKVNRHSGFALEVADAANCWKSIENWKHHPRHILLMFADSLERQAKVARHWAQQESPTVNAVRRN